MLEKIESNNVDGFFPKENDVWWSLQGIRKSSVLSVLFRVHLSTNFISSLTEFT